MGLNIARVGCIRSIRDGYMAATSKGRGLGLQRRLVQCNREAVHSLWSTRLGKVCGSDDGHGCPYSAKHFRAASYLPP